MSQSFAQASSATTLVASLRPARTSKEEVLKTYGPLTSCVVELIGVIPEVTQTFQIWPASCQTYYLNVSTLMNLPDLFFGLSAPKSLVGLSLYVSSKTSQCSYCTAHTASFALRRNLNPKAIVGDYTRVQAAVATVAEKISTIPATLTVEDVDKLYAQLPAKDVDWVVMGASAMGFLNKVMKALGVEIEPVVVEEVTPFMKGVGGKVFSKVDGPKNYACVLCLAPQVIRLERSWKKGIPRDLKKAQAFLKGKTGIEFPVLANLPQKAVCGFTTLLAINLDKQTSNIGLAAKAIIGFIFALVVSNKSLAELCRQFTLAQVPGFDEGIFAAIEKFVEDPSALDGLELGLDQGKDIMPIVQLARGVSFNPPNIHTNVPPKLIASSMAALTPEQIIETVTWVSILQSIHRIDTFYSVAGDRSTDKKKGLFQGLRSLGIK